jgi:hypothetical protein
MRKVFVLNDTGHDYSDADRFGQVIVCTDTSVDRWDISKMYVRLRDALKDADADDYIMISSLTSLCSVASAIMAERFGEVHFLLFRDGKYIARDLVLDN